MQSREATLISVEDSRLAKLRRDDFVRFREDHPLTALLLLGFFLLTSIIVAASMLRKVVSDSMVF